MKIKKNYKILKFSKFREMIQSLIELDYCSNTQALNLFPITITWKEVSKILPNANIFTLATRLALMYSNFNFGGYHINHISRFSKLTIKTPSNDTRKSSHLPWLWNTLTINKGFWVVIFFLNSSVLWEM